MTMFTRDSHIIAEFGSSWKNELQWQNAQCQTATVKNEEFGVQCLHTQNDWVQTESNQEHGLMPAIAVNQSQLLDVLIKVEPLLLQCFISNSKTRAFEDVVRDRKKGTTKLSCVYHLKHKELDAQVTSLTWNASGSTVAVGYGRFDHTDWCTHSAAVSTWNLDRRTVTEDKADVTIDVGCCVTSLTFHPSNPALLLGGTFNGEVLVWNLSQEDDLLLAVSETSEDSHQEPVNDVHWAADGTAKGKLCNVFSVGADGKILLWKIDQKKHILSLIDGFSVTASSLPRALRAKGVDRRSKVGLTSLRFSHHDPDTFLVGSESGCVFRGSTRGGELTEKHVSGQLKSPITLTYRPHHGPVLAVDCSMFHRQAFVSCGQDQSLHIYNMLQAQPVAVVEPGKGYLFDVAWSPVCPSLMAVATETGHLLLFDVSCANFVPIYTLDVTKTRRPVFYVRFNHSRTNLLATGDAEGSVRVFCLSKDLVSSSQHQLSRLNRLIDTGVE